MTALMISVLIGGGLGALLGRTCEKSRGRKVKRIAVILKL